jgi:hypothetical protein
MGSLIGIIAISLAAQAAQSSSASGDASPQSNSAEGDISIQFIVAEQIRCAAEIERFSFVAHESGYSALEPGGKLILNNVYRVLHGKQSTLVTTESWSRVLDDSSTGSQTQDASPGASRLLITPGFTVRWNDVTVPQAQIRWAEDWESLGKVAKNEYETAKLAYGYINSGALSFGMESPDALWKAVGKEYELSDDVRPFWNCVFTDSEKKFVRASRFRKSEPSSPW